MPELVLRPFMLCLILHRLGQPLGQRQQNGNGVLGDDRAMNPGGVGDDNVAPDQFRIHELVYGRGGRMDPAKFFCGDKLLRPQ